MDPPELAKPALRRRLRERRRAPPRAGRKAESERACRRLWRRLRHARDVALYLADEGEPDPLPLARWLWQSGHRVYAPCLSPDGHMTWRRWRAGTPLRRNRHGIREPALDVCTRRLDAVVLPLVAFDAAGHRLGRGGGHYDRALAALRGARRYGLAHDWQRVECVPVEPHDLRLHGVATPRRWHGGRPR